MNTVINLSCDGEPVQSLLNVALIYYRRIPKVTSRVMRATTPNYDTKDASNVSGWESNPRPGWISIDDRQHSTD